MEDDAARIESLERRLAEWERRTTALETQWSGFKRAARDGFLMIAQWIRKNGEVEENGE